jgi:hypothetical protein
MFDAFIISDDRGKDEFECLNENIYQLHEINGLGDINIIVAVANREVIYNLEQGGYSYVEPSKDIYTFLKEYKEYMEI